MRLQIRLSYKKSRQGELKLNNEELEEEWMVLHEELDALELALQI